MNNYAKYQSAGSAGTGIALSIIGLLFIFVPFIFSGVFEDSSLAFGTGTILAFVALGASLTIIGVILLLLTKLYIKAPANEALVITGWRKKTVVDGGGFFIPMFQELMPVPLETMKLPIEKKDEEAFITQDNLRANIAAEFFIKIPKDQEKINIAATSLGKDGGITPKSILDLVRDKLISSLRDAVAKKRLEELHSDRNGFAGEVEKSVTSALEQNGIELESVTISNLDQADYANLNLNNVFNAQGAKTVAAITEVAKKEKEQIELDNRLAIQMMQVETTKKINEQKIEEEKSNALREQNIMIAKAEADKEARQKAAALSKEAETAEIDKAKAIEVAEIKKEQAKELAEIEKSKALAIQEEDRLKAKEVAELARKIEVAQKREAEAAAQAEANKAEALARKEEEEVTTVQIKAEAERAKVKQVIAKESEAEQAKIVENNNADVEAYKTKTLAAAERQAAEDKAAALTAEAEAEKAAAIARAQGKKAEEMIPVEVQKETVKVEAERVAVLEKELKAKSEHAEVSVRLETNLAQIEAEKEIGIENARSMGNALAAANIQIYGNESTIDSVYGQFTQGAKKAMFLNTLSENLDLNGVDSVSQNMIRNYMIGQETAMLTEGFFENAPTEVLSLLKTTGGSIASIVALGANLLGRSPKNEEIERLRKAVEAAQQSALPKGNQE